MSSPLLEREAKFHAPLDFELPDLNGAVKGVIADPPQTRRLKTEYFDTQGYTLARWGCNLRYRAGEGWTLKLPGSVDGAVMTRSELTFGGSSEAPPPDAVALVKAYVRGAPLRPIARLNTVRHSVTLRSVDGEKLATVVDDEVSVADGARRAGRFRELEVELESSAPPKLLRALQTRLGSAGALAPDPTPKLVRALGLRAPEVIADQPKPTPDASATDLVRYAIGLSMVRLLRHDPLIRYNFDPEVVHQARVATRRVRSDLRTFRPLLNKRWTDSLRAQLKELGKKLGAVRDLDVLIGRIETAVDKAPPEERDPGRKIASLFDADRRDACDALIGFMRSQQYFELLDGIVAAAKKPVVLQAAAKPAIAVLPPLFADQWNDAKDAAKTAAQTPTDEALHALRIRVKRCRYAAEALTPIVKKRAKAFARAARNLQDALGDYRDAMTAYQRLHELAQSDEVAFSAGALAMIELREAARSKSEWESLWRDLIAAAKKMRKWL